jgi:hypothetical protein
MPASLSAESNAAGRPDERLAGQVLLVAGLLADQHEIGPFWTLAGHRLGGVAIEGTSRALAFGRRQRPQRFDGATAFVIGPLIHNEGRMPDGRKRSKVRV